MENQKIFYRHDRLKRGVCFNWCEHKLEKIVKIVQRSYLQPKSEMIVNETTMDESLFRNAMDDRYKHNRLINICVNWRLKHEYNFMAYSEIEYCVTNPSRNNFQFDTLDRFCVGVVIAIITCVTISTIYDYKLKFRRNINNHYKNECFEEVEKILTSFSIPRNWQKMIMTPNLNELRVLTSIKAFFTAAVVLSHVLLINIALPLANTDYVEWKKARLLTTLLLNGSQIMQSFLTISGFLVAYNFFNFIQKQGKCQFGYGILAVLHRYFR